MDTKPPTNVSNDSPAPQQGRKPTEEDLFYWDWAKDTLKNSISLVNKVLVIILTLNSALLAVSVFFNNDTLPQKEKLIVILSFIFSLLIALIGLIMYEGKVQLDTPSTIKKHKVDAFKYKKVFLFSSLIFLFLGFVFIISNLIYQLLE